MTKIEQRKFRGVLRQIQADLEESSSSDREAVAVEASADELDRIQRAQERDLAVSRLDRNAKRLREVRSALIRLDAGTFGICLDCENDISVKRLAAMPWTASCIACQEAAETASQPPFPSGETLLSVSD